MNGERERERGGGRGMEGERDGGRGGREGGREAKFLINKKINSCSDTLRFFVAVPVTQ